MFKFTVHDKSSTESRFSRLIRCLPDASIINTSVINIAGSPLCKLDDHISSYICENAHLSLGKIGGIICWSYNLGTWNHDTASPHSRSSNIEEHIDSYQLQLPATLRTLVSRYIQVWGAETESVSLIELLFPLPSNYLTDYVVTAFQSMVPK